VTADLTALYERGKAAWPAVTLSPEAFAAWVKEHGEPPEAYAADAWLACACLERVPAALAACEAHTFPEVAAAVARFAPRLQVDEIQQELRQRVFLGVAGGAPKLREYSGRGALGRWLRAVAVRIALNLLRGAPEQPHVTLGDDDFLSGDSPELAHMKSLYRGEFKKAFAEALATLDPELQNHLRLYYLDGLGVVELANVFHSSAPTVSRRLQKARAEVLEATRKILKQRLGVDGEELESIMRLIQSRLSLDVGALKDDAE